MDILFVRLHAFLLPSLPYFLISKIADVSRTPCQPLGCLAPYPLYHSQLYQYHNFTTAAAERNSAELARVGSTSLKIQAVLKKWVNCILQGLVRVLATQGVGQQATAPIVKLAESANVGIGLTNMLIQAALCACLGIP